MEALQSFKRPERQPVYLAIRGETVDNPTTEEVVREIETAVMAPIRLIYELSISCGDDFWTYPGFVTNVANTLLSSLRRWEQLSGYL